MKTLLWLAAALASGAIGFYVGVGYGAKTLGAIAAQNEVYDGVERISVSLTALAQADVARSNQLHEQNLKSALLQIGTYSTSVSYWHCSDKERDTMQAARAYAHGHPALLGGPLQEFELRGLDWCTPSKGGA